MGGTRSTKWGEKRNAYRLLVGNQRERVHYEDQDGGGWITLRWILRDRIGWCGLD
jgi:hypothetical protein